MATTTPATGMNPLLIAAMQKKFSDLGLGDLWTLIDGYLTSGLTETADIFNVLQTDPAAQAVLDTRFPAMKARAAAGKPISIENYLDMEDEYASKIKSSGLPAGFYDKRADWTQWIIDDNSPDEIGARIGVAAQAVQQADRTVRQALKDYYNVDDAGIMAYFLDQKVGADVLQSRYSATVAGGAYKSQGLNLGKGLAEEIGNSGVNPGNFAAGAANVAGDIQSAQDLGNIYGEDLSSEDLTRSRFDLAGGAAATKKKNRLASAERAAFSGSSAAQNGSLTRSASGMI